MGCSLSAQNTAFTGHGHLYALALISLYIELKYTAVDSDCRLSCIH